MSISEFLAEFEDKDFHSDKWLPYSTFDPPFRRQELRAMRRAGVIELSETQKRFRLMVTTKFVALAA